MDSLSEALTVPKDVYIHHFGQFPLQDLGTDSEKAWVGELERRGQKIEAANREIARGFENLLGPDSNEAISANIISRLTRPITQIAIDQYKVKDKTKEYSWLDVSPTTTNEFIEEIKRIRSDPNLQLFLQENDTINVGLETLIKLSSLKEEEVIQSLTLEYEELCKKAINDGKPILWFSYFTGGYYIHSENSEVNTPMFEIGVDLVFPLSKDLKKKAQDYNDLAIKNMSELSGRDRSNFTSQNVIGWTVASAGFSILSQTAGMALDGDKGGLFLSINSYKEKYKKVWMKALKISGEDENTQYIDYLLALYFHHEVGHNFFPSGDEFDEILTDIPTAVSLLTLVDDLDKKKMVIFSLAELIPEISAKVTENLTVNGYTYSAIFLTNKFIEHGIVTLEGEQMIVNLDEDKIKSFTVDVMAVHQGLVTGDEKIKEEIRAIRPSPAAKKLAEILS